jgi:hypothetical protein
LLLALALASSVLVAALIAPSATLARAREATCPSSAARGRLKDRAHPCALRRKDKGHGKTKHHTEHTLAGAPRGASRTLVAASCEDGSTPVRARDGSFSCDDGSEPECEDGETPILASNGKRLLCPVFSEEGASSSEAECEAEGGSTCDGETGSEEACEASAGDSTASLCEGESES